MIPDRTFLPHVALRYTLAGFGAGFGVLLLAWAIDLQASHFRSPEIRKTGDPLIAILSDRHRQNPVLWLIDILPIASGLVAGQIGRQMSQRSLADAERKRSLECQRRASSELAQNSQAYLGNLNATLRGITTTAAEALGLDGVSIWRYDSPDRQRLTALECYNVATNHHDQGWMLDLVPAGDQSKVILSDRGFAIADITLEPFAPDIVRTYCDQQQILSLLSVPVWQDGRVCGFVWFERKTPPRRWSEDTQQFAHSISDFISLALETSVRTSIEKAHWESEERFRWLSEATFEGIIIYADRVIVDTNQAIVSLFGYDSDELIGMDPLDLLAPASRSTIELYEKSGSEQSIEAIGQHKNGSRLPIELQGRQLPYYGQKVRTIAVRNITDRHRAEAALRDSESRYRAISQLTSDYIYAADVSLNGDLSFEWVTQAFERISGYTTQDLETRGWMSIVVPDDVDQLRQFAIERLLGSGSLDYRIVTKTGETRWLRDYARPHWKNNRVDDRKLLGAVQDITPAKIAEAELRDAKTTAETANRLKSAFLANMSHELRTPLNAIIGYSEIMCEEAEDNGDEDTIEDLKKISTAGNYLLSLINDILDISKIEAGKMELYLEPFDLTVFIEEVSDTIAPLIQKNGNRFETCCEVTQPMRADLGKLRQIAINLLGNAAKFTENGTISLTIEPYTDAIEPQPGDPHVYLDQVQQPIATPSAEVVTTSTESSIEISARTAEPPSPSEPAFIVLSVRDTGIGIDPDRLAVLFEPFVQENASTSQHYGGTGLGLTIAQRFCHLMGGRLNVESEVNRGSIFRAILPLDVPDRQTRSPDSEVTTSA
jgi:PAS domain S-box-containing protein